MEKNTDVKIKSVMVKGSTSRIIADAAKMK